MICKTCNKEFHYCNSCDIDEWQNTGYCSKDCMLSSLEWEVRELAFVKFDQMLSSQQKLQFRDILTEYTDYQLDYFLSKYM